MSHVVFITGGTGNIGAPMVRSLLAEPSVRKVIALVRAASPEAGNDRLCKAIELATGSSCPAALMHKLQIIPGDITTERLGLTSQCFSALGSEVTHIIHAAAQTQFTLPLECARSVNFIGTQNVIALARRAQERGCLRRVIHVSTAFVCGHRAGFIPEDYTAPETFANTYEQTKFETEQWLCDNTSNLPLTIVRPTIVVGDSVTGRINTFNVLYTPLQWILRGLLTVPPDSENVLLDVVSVDYVVRSLSFLLFNDHDNSRPIHLAAGRERCVTVGQVVETATRFAEACGHPCQTTRSTRHISAMSVYDAHISIERDFDTCSADHLLAPHGIVPRHLSEYFAALMAYAFQSNWGRRVVTGSGGNELCAA